MNYALGSLRKLDKAAGLTCNDSANFRSAADSLVAVGNELALGYVEVRGHPTMERHIFDLQQSAHLYRTLEVQLQGLTRTR